MDSPSSNLDTEHPGFAGDPTPDSPSSLAASRAGKEPENAVTVTPRTQFVTVGVGVVAMAALVALLSRSKPEAVAVVNPNSPRVDGRSVVLSEETAQRLGIQTAVVRDAQLTPIIKVVGTVTFDPEYVAAVGTRLKGLVRRVARFEGDRVEKGELLADIDSPELGSAQASVLMFRAQLKAAELNHAREIELEGRGLTTAREVEDAAATLEEFRAKLLAAEQQVSALGGAAVRDHQTSTIGLHQLQSPLAGTVVERFVSAGQSVEGHLTAFRIADLDHLWVELDVFERSLQSTHKGDRVELRPLSEPNATIVGQVAYVGDQIDPSTRTAAVRVEIDNRERKLRPGQAVAAKIHAAVGASGKVAQVPHAAVTFVDGKPTVFVAESATRYTAVPVELGESDREDRQIMSGIQVGQKVVTEGVFPLKSELYR
jgi:cobalt-zinc-cadmium efflux system membrane fusion protein